MASNDDESLNSKALSDLADKLSALATTIKESVIAEKSPVDVVTSTGTLMSCCRLMLDHYGNLMREVPEDRKFPIGFTRG